MKLGLIIKLTSAGEQENISINKNEEWAKYATDSRSILKNLDGFDGSGKSIIIVKILGDLGYLVGIIKARSDGSGRANDNTTAWIHVPDKLKIEGEALEEVINSVKEQLDASMNINENDLKKSFNQDYNNKDIDYSALSYIGMYNPEGCIGWQFYGTGTVYSLQDFLGDAIAQTSYQKYQCIGFIEKPCELSIVGGEIINLEPKKPIIINAPIDHKGNYKPYIKINKNDSLFKYKLEIPSNTPLTVVWKKEGYSDIKKDLIDNDPSSLDIKDNERKLVIKRAWIHIFDHEGRKLDDANIFINGKQLFSNSIEISKADSVNNQIKIEVKHDGYNDKTVTTNISDNINIILEDRYYSKEYTLRIKDGKNLKSDATITIKMKDRYADMPLKGYSPDSDNNLVYQNTLKTKITWFAIGGVVCSVILALFLYIYCGHKQTDTTKPVETTVVTKGPDIKDEDSQNNRTIQYLKKDTWHKDSLSQYPLTKNLFDNMNSFNLDCIIQLENDEVLKNVENVKNLVEAAKESKDNNINPSNGKEKFDGKYNGKTDPEISIKNYIDWITTEHSDIQKIKQPDTTTLPTPTQKPENNTTEKEKNKSADDNSNSTGSSRDLQ